MFSMIKIRPEIAFATFVASWYTKNLNHFHIKDVKTILRYLKGFKNWGIVYGEDARY